MSHSTTMFLELTFSLGGGGQRFEEAMVLNGDGTLLAVTATRATHDMEILWPLQLGKLYLHCDNENRFHWNVFRGDCCNESYRGNGIGNVMIRLTVGGGRQ